MKITLKATEYLTSDEIVKALKELQSTQGWKIIQEFSEEDMKRLQLNIKDIEKEILDSETIDNKQLIRLKEKRHFQEELMKIHLINIPQLIINKIEQLKQESQSTEKIELDPFETVESLTN